MSTEDLGGTIVTYWLWSSKEALRETVVLDEGRGIGDGEMPGCVSTVNERVDDERRFGVSGEIARCDEAEGGIRSDGLLDTRPTEFCCNCEVVVSATVSVAEVDELK